MLTRKPSRAHARNARLPAWTITSSEDHRLPYQRRRAGALLPGAFQGCGDAPHTLKNCHILVLGSGQGEGSMQVLVTPNKGPWPGCVTVIQRCTSESFPSRSDQSGRCQ